MLSAFLLSLLTYLTGSVALIEILTWEKGKANMYADFMLKCLSVFRKFLKMFLS